MSLDTAFLEFMPHTLTEYAWQGANQYGEASYSTSATTYQCMVEERPDMVRNTFGDEVVSSHVVYVASTSRLDMTSLYVLPDGSEPPIIRSDAFSDESGNIHHCVLFFGSGAA